MSEMILLLLAVVSLWWHGSYYQIFDGFLGHEVEARVCAAPGLDCHLERVSDTPGLSSQPSAAVCADQLHVVWQDDTPGYPTLYHARPSGGPVWLSGPVTLEHVVATDPALVCRGEVLTLYYRSRGSLWHRDWTAGAWGPELAGGQPRLWLPLTNE